jgi:hypothetical protein
MDSNTVAYNAYKLEIIERTDMTTDSTQLSEWNLLMYNQEIIIPGISYPQPSYTITKDLETVSIIPGQTDYTNWQINPSLPTGLSIGATTGIISGIATQAMEATEYTVSATYTNGLTYQTTITLTVLACNLPNYVYVNIKKLNSISTETYSISNADAEVIVSGTNDVTICLTVGDYTVVMDSTTGAAWTDASYLMISSIMHGEQVVLEKARMNKANGESFTFTLKYPIAPAAFNTNIKYYLAESSVPSGWYTTAPSDWTTLDDANRISTAVKTQLFFHSFNIDSKTGTNAFELRVKAKSGIVVYINGAEFYRRYLPEGDITTSTTASGGQDTAYWHSIVGCSSILNEGSNTIAIGIVNLGDSATTMAFDMTLRLITSTVLIPRNWDITNNADKLFDNNPATVATISRTAGEDTEITMNFKDNGAMVVNNYCITSSSETYNNDPLNWTVSGSKDGSTYTEIKSESNYYFESRSTSYCFFMSTNNVAYSYYKLTLKDTRGSDATHYSIADWDLLVEDLTAADVPELSFNPAVMVGYTNAPFPEITSSSDYYSSFSIEPALPTGLSIVPSNGVIRGSASQPFTASIFTVSAINHLGQTKTTTISVAVEMCADDKVSFTLEVELKTGATLCSFDLLNAAGDIVTSRDTLYDNTPFTIPMCEAATTYTLRLKKTNTAGWGENKINVRLADGTLLMSEALAAGSTQKDYNFNPAYVIAPQWTEWNYLVDGSAAPSGWNTVTGAPEWSAARAGNYPAATGVTQYYYKKFTVESLDAFSVLDIGVNVKAGAVVYLNGEEIRRINMPQGDITSSTAATKELAQYTRIITGELVQKERVKVGENIVAVELHRYQQNEETNSFDASAIFILNNMLMIIEGSGSSNPIAYEEDKGVDKAFDNNSSTKMTTSGSCTGVSVAWKYNHNRQEVITNYGLENGNGCNTNAPSGWRIEGSNDGENWDLLHVRENTKFTASMEQKRFDFYNDDDYNSYRFVSTECENLKLSSSEVCDTGFQLGEFYLFAKRIGDFCPSVGIYRPAMEGDYSYVSCPALYSGYKERYCAGGQLSEEINNCVPMSPTGVAFEEPAMTFYLNKAATPVTPTIVAAEYTVSIFPTLPTGLSLDASTGTISGTPTTLTEKKAHTVRVVNSSGSYSAMITVEVVEAPINWILIIILIVIIVIIIIIIVVVVVMMSKKKSKKNIPKNSKGAKITKTASAAPVKTKAVVKV